MMLKRLAIVAHGGMIWTANDTWVKATNVLTPRLFHHGRHDLAEDEAARAKEYAADDGYFPSDPETVDVITIYLTIPDVPLGLAD